MKIAVFITSGDFEKWQEIIPHAAQDGVYDPKLTLVEKTSSIYGYSYTIGEMQLNGYKDFLKLVEFIDEEIILRPKHRNPELEDYDMVIEIYDDYRE